MSEVENLIWGWLNNKNYELKSRGNKLVHYTSSYNAVNILKDKELWMRNPTIMNDYSELQHGLNQVGKYFFDENLEFKITNVSDYTKSLLVKSINKFNSIWNDLSLDNLIFVACLSEKLEDEEDIGRLSMWRAYGGDHGVALELDNPEKTLGLNIFLHPVIYKDEELLQVLDDLVWGLESCSSILQSSNQEALIEHIVLRLLLLVVCKKHIGFKEEMEWRIVDMHNLIPTSDEFKLALEVERISGIPQLIKKLKIDGKLTSHLDIKNMLHKVLIGPTTYADQQAMAFMHLLIDQKYPNPQDKIVATKIPLRK